MSRAVAALVAASVWLVGCGGGDRPFAASDAWARPTPATATNGVVYLDVSSDIEDSLIGVDVPDDVAAYAELHTSDAAGGGAHEHGAVAGGVVTMEQVEEVMIGADSTVMFRPGGNHIMLIDLSRPLVLGDAFDATLRFSSGRSIETTVTVADNPPS